MLLDKPPDRYGLAPPAAQFIPTGCAVLDAAIGGGYVRGRMANIVGDSSTGKSGLAIEACANFRLLHPKGRIFYDEVEAAFDISYARALGLPIDLIEFPDPKHDTVQQFARSLEKFADSLKSKQPGLYIVDSLDALDDESDVEHRAKVARALARGEEAKGSYGTGKAKAMSALFRAVVRKLGKCDTTLLIISQVRENIGVSFGERYIRTGGKAMDFYASHVIWLAQTGKIEVQRGGVKRKIGINIKALCKKNKIAPPYRSAEFDLLFNYGVDDAAASIKWLYDNGGGKTLGISDSKGAAALAEKVAALPPARNAQARAALAVKVKKLNAAIEARFAPPHGKYG